AAPAPTPEPSGGLPRLPELLKCELMPMPALGMRCSTSLTELRPVFLMSWSAMDSRGASRSSGLRRMREPVTTILAPYEGGVACDWFCAASGGGVQLCAP